MTSWFFGGAAIDVAKPDAQSRRRKTPGFQTPVRASLRVIHSYSPRSRLKHFILQSGPIPILRCPQIWKHIIANKVRTMIKDKAPRDFLMGADEFRSSRGIPKSRKTDQTTPRANPMKTPLQIRLPLPWKPRSRALSKAAIEQKTKRDECPSQAFVGDISV